MDTMPEEIVRAISVLKNGGIAVFPTDTAFGIGCRIDCKAAVDRLFALRKRPVTKATPVLVDSVAMALAYYQSPSDIVRHLMEQYWPGALTIVATCNKQLIYSPIRGGQDSVGLRMPDHPAILALIEGVGVPVIGSSANFHNEPTPYRVSELNTELTKQVDMIVSGVCSCMQESTVVDCTGEKVRIIRQGAVRIAKPFI